ncbi:hypothetical protein [Hanstruepera ponticola]|uniref:hypothetical protein n=1 Tax=Hanstruepera ponticola TaxID=2042995 RepID=UPI000CF07B53|nr:hypothetical protein [Hanstruepera ponticola]
MKIISAILSIIAVALIIYNAMMVDLNNPFEGDSLIALITIFAALCAIILLQILMVSKKIEAKSKSRK